MSYTIIIFAKNIYIVSIHKGGIFTNKECYFHNVKAALFFVLETCFTALYLLNQITS